MSMSFSDEGSDLENHVRVTWSPACTGASMQGDWHSGDKMKRKSWACCDFCAVFAYPGIKDRVSVLKGNVRK